MSWSPALAMWPGIPGPPVPVSGLPRALSPRFCSLSTSPPQGGSRGSHPTCMALDKAL